MTCVRYTQLSGEAKAAAQQSESAATTKACRISFEKLLSAIRTVSLQNI